MRFFTAVDLATALEILDVILPPPDFPGSERGLLLPGVPSDDAAGRVRHHHRPHHLRRL